TALTLFLITTPHTPCSPLFPYTTLFRSLIAADDIGVVLARITQRAAVEVRAPRYLLAVRLESGGELRVHHRGFPEVEVELRAQRSEEHTSELQSPYDLVCRLLLEKKKTG